MSGYNHKVKTTCKFCREEFESFGLKKVCPGCETNMDRYFSSIKEYLVEFPNASVAEICNDLVIPSALIKYYLKEERLEIKSKSGNHFLYCERCKKPINTGRYCLNCEIEATRSEMGTVVMHNTENENMEREIAKFHINRFIKQK